MKLVILKKEIRKNTRFRVKKNRGTRGDSLLTKTSHTENGLRTLKIQYFS